VNFLLVKTGKPQSNEAGFQVLSQHVVLIGKKFTTCVRTIARVNANENGSLRALRTRSATRNPELNTKRHRPPGSLSIKEQIRL
jgi:hypothetical protein